MKQGIICDRCKEPINQRLLQSPLGGNERWEIIKHPDLVRTIGLDLCGKCVGEFKDWFDKKK